MSPPPFPPAIKVVVRTFWGEDSIVNFVFVCGWCDTECIVWGEPVVSWWTQKYRVDDFECWNCGTTCTPHDPPWTEA